MENSSQIPLLPPTEEKSHYLKNVLKNIIYKKFNTLVGCLLLALSSLLFAYLISTNGITSAIFLILVCLGVPVFLGVILYPRFGIVVLLLTAYLLFAIIRLGIDFPFGTLIDGLQVLLLLGIFVKQKKTISWTIYRGPVTVTLLIWVAYSIIELANPEAKSYLAWVYTIRSVAAVALFYFVFICHIQTVSFIRLILKIWLLLSVIGALYAFWQEYLGFSADEQEYLSLNPKVAALLFIDGHWRKFSIFSDPVAMSYNMVVSSLICLALLTCPIKIWKKIILSIFICIFLGAMLFSGTRGAYVLIPPSLLLFAILKYNKKILIYSIGVGIIMFVLIKIPTGNSTLYRFQTAFKPSDDASFNVRAINQKRIQPYILSHPIGGGLGSTGAWGERFAPDSYLAHFPPDSGYVRVAVEMGPIGLLLFCIFMFTILKTGINNYYRIKDPELKSYCLAMLLVVFALNLGNYPQEALVQFPSSIYFYLAAALLTITYRLDREKRIDI